MNRISLYLLLFSMSGICLESNAYGVDNERFPTGKTNSVPGQNYIRSFEEMDGLVMITSRLGGDSSEGTFGEWAKTTLHPEEENVLVVPFVKRDFSEVKMNIDMAERSASVYYQVNENNVKVYPVYIESIYGYKSPEDHLVERVIGAIYDDGTIAFGYHDNIAYDIQQHGWQSDYNLRVCVRKVNLFEYRPDEWTSLGKGWFEEDCFSKDMSHPVAYNVEIKQNKLKPYLYLLENPYRNEVWKGMNISEDDGYIIVDVSDPDCVLMVPGVPTGYKDDKYNHNSLFAQNEVDSYFLYNNESNYYFHDNSKERIKNGWDSEYPVMIENLQNISNFKDGVVTLYNLQKDNMPAHLYIGNTVTYMNRHGWPSDKKIKIHIPSLSSVDSVSGESVEDTPEYFNLQGLKVNNPSSGEFIIEKRGNSYKKIIVY